jgi:hypothetical protein
MPCNTDGIVTLPEDSDQLTFNNVSLLRNEVSPFHDQGADLPCDGAGPTVDTYYGLAYGPKTTVPAALYGRTADLPEYSGDSLANLGYLRVPFRRIPRVLVRNRRELDAIVGSIQSADPSLKLVFRGQVREYTLQRSASTLNALYGDPTAIEPSLLPSAARAGTSLEVIGPEWSALVQLFLNDYVSALGRAHWISPRTYSDICGQMTNLVSGYSLWAFLISLAQHYGLPSAGLDVTPRLEVALYFALNDFTESPTADRWYFTTRVEATDQHSVIYLFSNTKRFFIDFSMVRPKGFPFARPDAQSAHFLHTGWGLATNAVATSLFMALYLDRSGDWGRLPRTSEMFPTPDNDPFGRHLEVALSMTGSTAFREFIRRFYWAVEG